MRPAPPTPAAAAAEPVDGTVVVDSAGNILGTLDTATGNVYDGADNVVGTLNEASGLVLDSDGASSAPSPTWSTERW